MGFGTRSSWVQILVLPFARCGNVETGIKFNVLKSLFPNLHDSGDHFHLSGQNIVRIK